MYLYVLCIGTIHTHNGIYFSIISALEKCTNLNGILKNEVCFLRFIDSRGFMELFYYIDMCNISFRGVDVIYTYYIHTLCTY